MTEAISVIAEADDASLAGLPGEGEGPVIRLLDREPREDDPSGELLIAPAGEGLWRTAPWPAADALFDLDPPPRNRCVLVGAAAEIAERAAARGVEIDSVDRLDADLLADAACVILPDAPGGALPARAFAVLAAGRLLLTPRLDTTFGLEDGLDHLEFADPDDAVTLIEAYRRVPEAFARITAWGRIKAEPQRASVVYARLAADLRLHGRGAV